MEKKEIRERFEEMLREIRGKKVGEITDASDIIRDLGFDSLELFELMAKVREEWGIDLFDEEDFINLYQSKFYGI